MLISLILLLAKNYIQEVPKMNSLESLILGLIAHAYQTDNYIITNEKYAPNIKRKIQIPNICELFHISYMNLFQFMRSEQIVL